MWPIFRLTTHDTTGMFYEYVEDQLEIVEREGQTEGGMNDPDREPNNLQRKKCYRHCAFVFSFVNRDQLPACVERTVRRIWPSATGMYMGFLDA